jgi:hypothetical protein
MPSLLRRLLTGEFDYAVPPRPRPVRPTLVEPPPSPPLFPPVEPDAAGWRRANHLFDHHNRCRCSTCALAAGLGAIVRRQEGK